MDFFIKEENVRPGNRGGRDQFKWDNIRLLNNKDRESYLGVTQSIGFLDKGGKWRKRDWWLSHEPDKIDKKESDSIRQEVDHIKKEEERLLRETLYPGLKEKNKTQGMIPPQQQPNQIQKAKLTDYEWKELMKKESNFTLDDSKLFEFYQNEDKKAGLGIKQTVSFRTNPYGEKQNLNRLEGTIEKNENTIDQDLQDNPYLRIDNKININKINYNQLNQQSSIVNKYLNEYMQEKKRDENPKNSIVDKEIKSETHKDIIKKKGRSRSRSRSRSRDKKHKKEKKSKKEKKHKKDKRRSRSSS